MSSQIEVKMSADNTEEFEYFRHKYNLDDLKPEELREIYQVISTRRMHFENLLWQIPLLSLTGESFLFTIILSSSSSTFSRSLSSFLAMILALASLSSLSRHRVSDVHDSQLVESIEKKLFTGSFHGKTFRESRQEFLNNNFPFRKRDFWDFIVRIMSKGRAYPVWMSVFIMVFLAALACFILNLSNQDIF